MFHTPVALDRRAAFGAKPLPFPAAMDLCQAQVPGAADCDGLRFAAQARKSASRNAFRPAFATGDWRVLSSFCIARRLPAGHRVLIPGRTDRTLSFVVEGTLWQEGTSAASPSTLLHPGVILGEDALFSDAPCTLDVRTLEDAFVLELPLQRQKELTASCPELAFELLRAAGAAIAARGRACAGRAELAAN